VQYQERRDGQVASPSPPTRRLSRAYLQHEYANRHLLPHYVLVFGRRREFEVESDQHIDADALRRERDLANRPDEQSMTFDSRVSGGLRSRQLPRCAVRSARDPASLRAVRMPSAPVSGSPFLSCASPSSSRARAASYGASTCCQRLGAEARRPVAAGHAASVMVGGSSQRVRLRRICGD
jgi:hypothetical protein